MNNLSYCVPTTPTFEMKFWLDKEIEHTEFIKALVPNLSENILSNLKKIKGQMEALLSRVKDYERKSNAQLMEMIATAVYLANCYWALLLKIKKQVTDPLLIELLQHIIEETKYFLRIMNHFQKELE